MKKQIDIIFLKTHNFFKNKKIKSINLFKNQGLCNTNYLVKTEKKAYVLRVFHSNRSVNINREFEYQAQKKAYNQNISAKPYYFDKKNSLLISKYIKGEHKDRLNNTQLKVLIKKVKKFHKIKLKSKKYDFSKDLKYYKKVLKDKNSLKLLFKLKKEIKKSKKYKNNYALCHHDLNCKNIIFSKKDVFIIDWEYAGINDIFFDLATICIEFKLNTRKTRVLLNTYFNKVRKKDLQKLETYKKIYFYICRLWFNANL